MSDINKFTTKEVLNKVLLDSSGNAVNAFSHTTQEAFNAALDNDNSRLNVNLVGGTIGGDVTINGDLTVNGDGVGAYDEIINGQLEVRGDATDSATGMTGFLTLSTAFTDINATDQLGRINFQAPLEAGGTDAILAGASIYGIAEATFANNNNSTGIAFATATSSVPIERMRIDSSGNVGIGTDSPATTLHVADDGSSNGIMSNQIVRITPSDANNGINIGSDGTDGMIGVTNNDTDLHFLSRTGGTYSKTMTIDSSGKVGIGIASPTSALVVQTTSALDVTTAPTGSVSIGSPSSTLQGAISGRQTSNTTALHLMGSGADGNTSGDMIFNVRENNNSTFATLTNSAFKFQHFSTDLVTILRNGNVGIGTASPEEKIHSTGAIVSTGVNDTGATAGTERAFIDLVSNKARIGHFRGTTSAGSGGLQLYTDSVERMSIDASGNVGIGTDSASGKIHVKETAGDEFLHSQMAMVLV